MLVPSVSDALYVAVRGIPSPPKPFGGVFNPHLELSQAMMRAVSREQEEDRLAFRV